VRGGSPADRALRREKAAAIPAGSQIWLRGTLAGVLPWSPLGEAICCTLSNGHALMNRYLEDGEPAIDSNRAETIPFRPGAALLKPPLSSAPRSTGR